MSEHDDELRDEELTDEERREAEALVEALERGRAREALPEDALETAALLRYSRDGELPEERRRAILDDVWASAKRPAPEERRTRAPGWLKWLVPVGGLGAMTAVALLFVTLQQAGDEAPVAQELPVAFPPPSAELLRAQASVASGEADDGELAEEMREYRGAVYAALDARYGGGGR